MKHTLAAALIVAWFAAFTPAWAEGTNTNRAAYLEGYRAAMKYIGSRERQRSAAIPRLEALKKLDPTARENLHLDYCIAMMWLSDLQPTYGERSDDEKFIEQVERMRKAYPDRHNDIRMVYLLSVLDNDVSPAVRRRKAEAERDRLREEREAAGIEEPPEPPRKPELSDDQKATIARELAFLRDGKDEVIPSPDCPLTVEFLAGGALGKLVGLYCYGTDTLEEKLAALDRLIAEFRSDPRTASYAADVESKKKWHVEQYALKLHPNAPRPPEALMAPAV